MNTQVRTFRAPDVRSALSAVKAALGPEAVIVSTQEVASGLLRGREIEVVAAVPAAEPAPAPAPAPEAPVRSRLPKALREAVSLGREPAPAPAPAPIDAAANLASYALVDERPVEAELAPRALAPDPEDLARAGSEVEFLFQALQEAREELRRVTLENRAARGLELPPQAAPVFARLVLHGVEETTAEGLLRRALAERRDGERLDAVVRRLLAEDLVPDRAPWLAPARRLGPGRTILALVGPTGVGKTTTVAKIAARALSESGLKVSLVTVDNYRIGAKEQLARYADIMQVPIHVARDRKELARAVARSGSADLVLIDTAGRANPTDMTRQAELVRSIPGVQLHLVLSAATGSQQLSEAAHRYRHLRPDRLVFTKLDETTATGSILTPALRVRRPVSCLADGQRVPEDLHPARTDRLVDLVLGA